MVDLYRSSPEYRELRRVRGKIYRQSLPMEVRKKRALEWKLRYSYGMTPEQYHQRLSDQGGGCAICEKSTRKFHVDHDHETNTVRGILCDACNKALGVFGDNMEGVMRVVSYLKRTKA